MKRNILSLSALLVAVAIIFSSCGKEDVGAPTVSVTGDNPYMLELGATWTDPGAIAKDEEDGEITSKITVSGDVNVDKVGEYVVTYKVTDKAGNEGSATRKVQVKASKLAGNYNVIETEGTETYNYAQTINVSDQGYNKLSFVAFGDFQNCNIIATFNETGFTAPATTFAVTGGQREVKDITGTYIKEGTSYRIATVSYKTKRTTETVYSTVTQAYSRQ